MFNRLIMFGRVFVLRAVAAANMAASEAEAQMQPCIPDLQTIFATFTAGFHILYLIKMRATLWHTASSFILTQKCLDTGKPASSEFYPDLFKTSFQESSLGIVVDQFQGAPIKVRGFGPSAESLQ